MTCPASNSIAIHCDEPEQTSANELLLALEENEYILIDDEIYFYDDITEMLDFFRESASEQEIRKMYIDKIAELME